MYPLYRCVLNVLFAGYYARARHVNAQYVFVFHVNGRHFGNSAVPGCSLHAVVASEAEPENDFGFGRSYFFTDGVSAYCQGCSN